MMTAHRRAFTCYREPSVHVNRGLSILLIEFPSNFVHYFLSMAIKDEVGPVYFRSATLPRPSFFPFQTPDPDAAVFFPLPSPKPVSATKKKNLNLNLNPNLNAAVPTPTHVQMLSNL
jgi:hypothetical protein